MKFSAMVMSCVQRRATLEATLSRLTASGWPNDPVVVLDDGVGAEPIDRIHRTWRRLVRSAAEASVDFVLLLEDDVVFNRWFWDNLRSWPLLAEVPRGHAFFASLYNPNHPFRRRRANERYFVADPRYAWGSQALVVTPPTARFLDAHWDEEEGNPDQRMPLLAARVSPVYYHVPSLVDHAPVPTTWGGIEHRSADFDADYRAG